jgi:adenylate kinase family enzyme
MRRIIRAVRRVSIVGTSGSGKSWLSARLAAKLSVPRLELDAVRHQPDWQDLPDAEFRERVARFVAQDGWVVDGNYFAVVTEAVVWPAADTVVWIDLPRRTVMRQVIWRTLKRAVIREELWNGNRERLREVLSRDPYKSVIRWSWTSYEPIRERYRAASVEPRWRDLTFIHVQSHHEMRRLLNVGAQA